MNLLDIFIVYCGALPLLLFFPSAFDIEIFFNKKKDIEKKLKERNM